MADRPFESGQTIDHIEGCPGCAYGTRFGSRHLDDCPFDIDAARMVDDRLSEHATVIR